MIYIKLDSDTLVEVDIDKRKTGLVSRKSLIDEIAICQQQIDNLPPALTDDDLLKWAKENYTDAGQRNREVLQTAIDELTKKLAEIDGKAIDNSLEVANAEKP